MSESLFIYEGDHWCARCAPPEAEGPIPADQEASDTPIHCAECEALIDAPLTPAGIEYVAEALSDYAEDGHGRAEVLDQWAQSLEACGGLTEAQADSLDGFRTVRAAEIRSGSLKA